MSVRHCLSVRCWASLVPDSSALGSRCDSRASRRTGAPGHCGAPAPHAPPRDRVAVWQVAELYEELKSRISQFNMNAGSRRPAVDQEYTHKQRFILQVRVALPFPSPGRRPLCARVWAAHCRLPRPEPVLSFRENRPLPASLSACRPHTE